MPLHVQIYLQRLNVDLSNGETVRLAAGCAFALATQALAELPILQFPPSLTAAAVLVAARKAQVRPCAWTLFHRSIVQPHVAILDTGKALHVLHVLIHTPSHFAKWQSENSCDVLLWPYVLRSRQI